MNRFLLLLRITSIRVVVVWLLYFGVFRFDSADWKDPVLFRTFVVDDLLARYRLVGMTRREINELLGVPRDGEFFERDTDDYVYEIGPDGGADSYWLRLEFENNRVVAMDIFHD